MNLGHSSNLSKLCFSPGKKGVGMSVSWALFLATVRNSWNNKIAHFANC